MLASLCIWRLQMSHLEVDKEHCMLVRLRCTVFCIRGISTRIVGPGLEIVRSHMIDARTFYAEKI